jgi:hypothetical protein
MNLALWGVDMAILAVHFEDDEAMADFVSWLSESGHSELGEYLYDRELGDLSLNFVDKENIKVD